MFVHHVHKDLRVHDRPQAQRRRQDIAHARGKGVKTAEGPEGGNQIGLTQENPENPAAGECALLDSASNLGVTR